MSTAPQAETPAEEPAVDDVVEAAPVPVLEPVQALERVEHPDVFTALAAAQAEFPSIPKRHTAEVRGKDGKPGYTYNYADLGDVLAATRPILAAHGLALIQRTKHRERDGRLELLTEVHHGASGGSIDSELELAQNPGAHQAFGGALTYLRRYEAVTLLGVAAEEDDDGANVEPIRSDVGHAPAPELPAWAKPVGGDKRRELIEVLGRIIGTERATRFADNVAGAYGGLPLAVFTTVRGIANATVEELDPLAFDDAEERRQGAKAAAAQDATAEAGDPPSPTSAEVDAAHAEAPDVPPAPTEEEAALAAAEEAGVDTSDLELEPAEEPGMEGSARDAEPAAPGSVQAPEIPEGATPGGATKYLRAAGCICPQPVETDGAPQRLDDACPVVGHGIPF